MSNNLRVGQKVVHVPNMGGEINHREREPYLPWPEPNGVYTIKEIKMLPTAGDLGRLSAGVALEEIPVPLDRQGRQVYWAASEFYPVAFRDIDISIFTEMLTNTKVSV